MTRRKVGPTITPAREPEPETLVTVRPDGSELIWHNTKSAALYLDLSVAKVAAISGTNELPSEWVGRRRGFFQHVLDEYKAREEEV